MYRLADLMEEHQEELATLESIDSGAVYTLALKTHVGMSITTFRYFAGWCDKIQVNKYDIFIVVMRVVNDIYVKISFVLRTNTYDWVLVRSLNH